MTTASRQRGRPLLGEGSLLSRQADDRTRNPMSETQSSTMPPGEATPPHRYTAALAGEIEARWQKRWESEGTFRAPNPVGPLAEPDHPAAGHPKFFIMDMFPYPSGAGLHVGHPLGYI